MLLSIPLFVSILFYRTFLKPNLGKELICAGIDALHVAVLENLASKSTLPTIIQFRHDVFNYLFNDNGKRVDGRNIFLDKEDFSRCSLPEEWDQLVDKLGDGVRVPFPVKARSFISKSPKKHTLIAGEIKEPPRFYLEKISINCMKQPFSLA